MLTRQELGFDTTQLHIDGAWGASDNSATLPVADPSHGEVIGAIAHGSPADIDAAVAAARGALHGDWGRMTAAHRGRLLLRMSAEVERHADHLAHLEAVDVGKPLSQARNDADALIRYLAFYGGAADKVHGETIPYQDGYTVYTLREPHGVTGHIIPWNYPMQIFGRSIGAALAMGNACVLKPAEDASLTCLALAHIAAEVGVPAGALNVVTGLGSEVGHALASHPDIDHISFTGSAAVGESIQTSAAANAVPVTLELGGKSPHIVFEDCDLDTALPTLVGACIQGAGQTCSAASRVLVHQSRHAELVERMAQAYRGLRAGPALADLDLGPIVSQKQKQRVEAFIDKGLADLTLAARGTIADNAPAQGHYVAPALFTDVPEQHHLAREEIFGPVQVIMPFADEADAVRLANDTPYGLVAGVWSRDGGRLMRMARALRSGQVFLNNYGAGGGVELPFGGTGRSGHGREKGFEALYGFSSLKTVSFFHG